MMQKRISFIVTIAALILTGCAEHKERVAEDVSIFPDGRKIDNDNFNGVAWLTMLAESDSLNTNSTERGCGKVSTGHPTLAWSKSR